MIKQSLILLLLALLAAHSASTASAAPPRQLAIAVMKWEGEYGTELYSAKHTSATSGGIYTINDDGSELRPLVAVGDVTTYPRYSLRGDWLHFQATTKGKSQVYRCRPDGSQLTNLSALHNLGAEWDHAFGTSLSADGKKMVYSVQGGQPTPRVIICNPDGSGAQWVAPDLGYIYMATPDKTGSRIAFSGPAREYRLMLTQEPFTDARLLTPEQPDSYVPQFIANGQALLFLRKDGDLYSVDLENDRVTRLTTGNDYVEFHLSKQDLHGSTDGPHVSPDGKRVAYIAKKNGVPQVCTMGIDGSNQQQITHREAPCGRVRWCPDNQRIAFVSFVDQYPQLFVIDTAGGESRQITNIKGGAVYWYDWRLESTKSNDS